MACQKTEQWLYKKINEQNIKKISDIKLALLLEQDQLILFQK